MTIIEFSQSYEREVVPADAPRVQRTEVRRAFFAGAWAVIQAMQEARRAAVSADSFEWPGPVLDELEEECSQFKSDVLKGRA